MFILNKDDLNRLQEVERQHKQELLDLQTNYKKELERIQDRYEVNQDLILKPCLERFIGQADNKTLYQAIINSICADVIWQHNLIEIDSKHPELGEHRKQSLTHYQDISMFPYDDENWYNFYYLDMLTDELATNRGDEGKELTQKLAPLYKRYGAMTLTKEQAERIIKNIPARFEIKD